MNWLNMTVIAVDQGTRPGDWVWGREIVGWIYQNFIVLAKYVGIGKYDGNIQDQIICSSFDSKINGSNIAVLLGRSLLREIVISALL